MTRLVGIAIREGKRKPMIKLDHAEISVDKGLENDFRGTPGKRQITVISEKVWNKVCVELSVSLDWTVRRANLMVDDIDLENKTGSQIQMGNVILEITGETDPCCRMDEAYPGLKKALESNWRGGATCRVIRGGNITINDQVSIQSH